MKKLKLYRNKEINNDTIVESQSDDYHFLCAKEDEDGARVGRDSIIKAIFEIPDDKVGTTVFLCNDDTNNYKIIGVTINDGELINYTDLEKVYYDKHFRRGYIFDRGGVYDVKFYFNLGNTNISSFFYYASDLITEIDLTEYYSKKVTTMYGFAFSKHKLKRIKGLEFFNTSALSSVGWFTRFDNNIEEIGDLSRWNTSALTSLNGTFCGCNKIKTLGDIGKWDVSKVTLFGTTFDGCYCLSLPNLSRWKVSNPKNMAGMFINVNSTSGYSDIGDIGSTWNVTSALTEMSSMFKDCHKNFSFHSDISNWDTSNVQSFSNTFWGFNGGNKYVGNIGKWVTSASTSMYGMFCSTDRLNVGKEDIDFSGWDTSKSLNFNHMFCNSDVVPNIFEQVKNWNVSSAKDFNYMFYNIHANTTPHVYEEEADLSSWDVSNVQDVGAMFFQVKLKGELNLSNWDLKSLSGTSMGMFGGVVCSYLHITDSYFNSPTTTEYIFNISLSKTNLMDIFYERLKDITDKSKFQGKKIVISDSWERNLTEEEVNKIQSIGFTIVYRNF